MKPLLAGLLLMSTTALAAPMSWSELQAIPLPAPVAHTAYGTAPQQFGELRLPEGKPPAAGWPVAVLLHGGCWLNAYDYRYFTRLAAALAEQGVASWTLEYRRLGDAGGGWPGTFLDVASGTDHLRVLAKTQPLDLSRVVASGHSAGGHLALWLAARSTLPKVSELHSAKPLSLRGVVGLAPIADLASYRVGAPESCNASVDQLLGGTLEEQPQRYAQASPLARLPLGVSQWLLVGELDGIVPPAGVAAYATAARDAGDHVAVIVEPGSGHFEHAAPASALGQKAVAAIRAALGL